MPTVVEASLPYHEISRLRLRFARNDTASLIPRRSRVYLLLRGKPRHSKPPCGAKNPEDEISDFVLRDVSVASLPQHDAMVPCGFLASPERGSTPQGVIGLREPLSRAKAARQLSHAGRNPRSVSICPCIWANAKKILRQRLSTFGRMQNFPSIGELRRQPPPPATREPPPSKGGSSIISPSPRVGRETQGEGRSKLSSPHEKTLAVASVFV